VTLFFAQGLASLSSLRSVGARFWSKMAFFNLISLPVILQEVLIRIPTKDDIGEMLGHSNSTVTEHYLASIDMESTFEINKHLLLVSLFTNMKIIRGLGRPPKK
jgi:hypothetical protein